MRQCSSSRSKFARLSSEGVGNVGGEGGTFVLSGRTVRWLHQSITYKPTPVQTQLLHRDGQTEMEASVPTGTHFQETQDRLRYIKLLSLQEGQPVERSLDAGHEVSIQYWYSPPDDEVTYTVKRFKGVVTLTDIPGQSETELTSAVGPKMLSIEPTESYTADGWQRGGDAPEAVEVTQLSEYPEIRLEEGEHETDKPEIISSSHCAQYLFAYDFIFMVKDNITRP